MEIKLGIKAKDTVSGFTGIVTEKCEYLNGCVQFRVIPKIDPKKSNEMPDGVWFDVEQLKYVDDGINVKPYEV